MAAVIPDCDPKPPTHHPLSSRGEMSKSRIISRVLQCVICELNPADVCLKGSVLACCFLSSCIQSWDFPAVSFSHSQFGQSTQGQLPPAWLH